MDFYGIITLLIIIIVPFLAAFAGAYYGVRHGFARNMREHERMISKPLFDSELQ